MATPSSSTRLRLWLIPLGLCLLGGGAFSLWQWGRAATEASPQRPFAIVTSGDTGGWIVPCGCAANQAGGMMRRGTFLTNLGKEKETLFLDAGGAPGGTSAYHQVKFEAILRGEKVMGIAAHNLGGPEAAFGPEYLRTVRASIGIPFVSANLRDNQGALVAEPLRLVEKGGKRIAVVGVLSRKYVVDGVRIDEPREAVLQATQDRKGQFDLLVVLAYLPEDELRQLARELPEADLVLGGPTGQSIKPEQVGPTLLAAATNKGKFLLHLEQKQGKRWDGQVVELGPQFADDATQQDNLKKYLAALEQRDFRAQETGFASSSAGQYPKDFLVAGTETCLACHQEDCKQWHGSKHGHAWETLQTRGFHVDSYCQQCHTTGYGLPGGFVSRTESPRRQAVGCESCHGPSLAHVRDPKQRTPFVARDQCLRCHDAENSPTFDYQTYWERIVHGKSPAKATAK